MPERRYAEHVQRVVLIVPYWRHVHITELMNQLRRRIAVANDEHSIAIMLVHDARDETFEVRSGYHNHLLSQTRGKGSSRLLRTSGVADVNRVDLPYSLATTKHLRKTFSPLL